MNPTPVPPLPEAKLTSIDLRERTEEPCDRDCFLFINELEDDEVRLPNMLIACLTTCSQENLDNWTMADQVDFNTALKWMPDTLPCDLAIIFKKPCREVHLFLPLNAHVSSFPMQTYYRRKTVFPDIEIEDVDPDPPMRKPHLKIIREWGQFHLNSSIGLTCALLARLPEQLAPYANPIFFAQMTMALSGIKDRIMQSRWTVQQQRLCLLSEGGILREKLWLLCNLLVSSGRHVLRLELIC